MPRRGYTNLTIKDPKKYDKMKQMFEKYSTTDYQWIDYVTEVLETAIQREKYITENFSDLKFIGSTTQGCVIEDTKLNKTIDIKIENGKVMMNPYNERYAVFVLMNPRLRL